MHHLKQLVIDANAWQKRGTIGIVNKVKAVVIIIVSLIHDLIYVK